MIADLAIVHPVNPFVNGFGLHLMNVTASDQLSGIIRIPYIFYGTKDKEVQRRCPICIFCFGFFELQTNTVIHRDI